MRWRNVTGATANICRIHKKTALRRLLHLFSILWLIMAMMLELHSSRVRVSGWCIVGPLMTRRLPSPRSPTVVAMLSRGKLGANAAMHTIPTYSMTLSRANPLTLPRTYTTLATETLCCKRSRDGESSTWLGSSTDTPKFLIMRSMSTATAAAPASRGGKSRVTSGRPFSMLFAENTIGDGGEHRSRFSELVIEPEGFSNDDDKQVPRDMAANETMPVLSFPGGGIFFWWQAGCVTALHDHFNLTDAAYVGGSAGALAAALAACDVDMDDAMDLALALCDKNNVWRRPLGLAGVWGRMVRQWLDELLPADADQICNGRVHLLVLPLRPFPPRRKTIGHFKSKDDLIDALMASVHIPYFMDKRFAARFRGRRHLDGSFRASKAKLSLGPDRPTAWFDYSDDSDLDRMHFLSLTTRQGLLDLRSSGYQYVQKMKQDGGLDFLTPLTKEEVEKLVT